MNLWATWCVPCAKEMPELERLREELARSGVDLVGLSVDGPETVGDVPRYAAEREVGYPLYTVTPEALDLLYPTGEATVPVTLLLDADGRVLDVYSGWSARSRAAIERLVFPGS